MAPTPTLPDLKYQAAEKATSATPIQFPRLLTLWHLTSLDAPTVAVTWCLAFAWTANIHLPWWLPTILGLSAWAFYIIDRLLDAMKYEQGRVPTFWVRSRVPHPFRSLIAKWVGSIPPRVPHISPLRCASDNLRERHHFHWKYRRVFLPIAFASTTIAVVLVTLEMSLAAQTRNSVLALASIAYLTSVHARPSLRIPKELLVAVVFTAACTLPVLARTPSPRLALIPCVLTFTVLAWLNCQAIETWESSLPKFAAPIGRATLAFALAAFSLAGFCVLEHYLRLAALITAAALSTVLLALLDKIKSRMSLTTLRTAADLALLTPIILLAIR